MTKGGSVGPNGGDGKEGKETEASQPVRGGKKKGQLVLRETIV